MHKYNNADHSMLTAMVAVDNIAVGELSKANLWEINTEQEYNEEKAAAQATEKPSPVKEGMVERAGARRQGIPAWLEYVWGNKWNRCCLPRRTDGFRRRSVSNNSGFPRGINHRSFTLWWSECKLHL